MTTELHQKLIEHPMIGSVRMRKRDDNLYWVEVNYRSSPEAKPGDHDYTWFSKTDATSHSYESALRRVSNILQNLGIVIESQ